MPHAVPPSTPADDAWLHALITWADDCAIPKDRLPCNQKKLRTLTQIDLSCCELTSLPASLQEQLDLSIALDGVHEGMYHNGALNRLYRRFHA